MEIEFTKMHGLGNDFVVIDAINQHIAIMDRRKPVGRRADLDVILAAFILVAAWLMVRLGRERENRVRHRRHVTLGCSIKNIAYEKVLLILTIGKERGPVVFRDFTHHPVTFVISHTAVKRFVISHTQRPLS